MAATKKRKGLGWKPDLPDIRDYSYRLRLPHEVAAPLPPSVDLRPQMPDIWDQQTIGSCTAFAIGGLVGFERARQQLPIWTPSMLFIYYVERVIEHTVKQDAGAELRDGMKAIASTGTPPEKDWPYVVANFAKKPPSRAYRDAKLDLATNYFRIDNTRLDDMKACLAAGFPFCLGFTVYSSFWSVGSDGVCPMPQPNEQIEGGHAIDVVGYDDGTGRFTARNSWGLSWPEGATGATQGHFYVDYAYFTNSDLAADAWTLRQLSGLMTERE